MAGLIYTANIGSYDSIKDWHTEEGVEYASQTRATGAVGKLEFPIREAREVKVMMPINRPDYDWYLWLDGSMQIVAPILPLVEKLLASEHDFAAFKHNEWQCAYKEIEACKERRKDSPTNLQKMWDELNRRKFPKNFGHAATGVLWRRNTELVKNHARKWQHHLHNFTRRDQCSFMLNLWELDAYVEWIPGLHVRNKWFKYHRGHK